MIVATVSGARARHFDRKTKSGLKRRACETTQAWVSFEPSSLLARRSSISLVLWPALRSARSVPRSIRHWLALPIIRTRTMRSLLEESSLGAAPTGPGCVIYTSSDRNRRQLDLRGHTD